MKQKRVRRLMKIVNWKTIYREPRTKVSNIEHKKYPYVVKNLRVTHKNQVWITDMAYISVSMGFMYYTRFVLNLLVNNKM